MRPVVGRSRFLILLGLLGWSVLFLPSARAQVENPFMGESFLDGATTLAARGTVRWKLAADNQLANLVAKDSVSLEKKNMFLSCDQLVYVAATTTSTSHLIAKESVSLKTKDLFLSCDTLVYVAAITTSTSRLEALGNPVHFIQEGAFKGECKKLEVFPDEGKSILSGNPVVQQTMAGGEVLTQKGDRILIIQSSSGVDVLVDGPAETVIPGFQLPAQGAAPPAAKSGAAKPPPAPTGTNGEKKQPEKPSKKPPDKPAAKPEITPAGGPPLDLDKITKEAADEKK